MPEGATKAYLTVIEKNPCGEKSPAQRCVITGGMESGSKATKVRNALHDSDKTPLLAFHQYSFLFPTFSNLYENKKIENPLSLLDSIYTELSGFCKFLHGHLKEDGVLFVEDFDTEAEARIFANKLLKTYKNLQEYGIWG